MTKMLLPDVNVWLALTFDAHQHHPIAKSWFDALTTEVCVFLRMTQQGFLRLATNRQVFGASTRTLSEAWRDYDALQNDPRVLFVAEPLYIEPKWRAFTQGRGFSTHIWNDAYLAAVAQVAGLEIVTFDQGFKQYHSVPCTLLS